LEFHVFSHLKLCRISDFVLRIFCSWRALRLCASHSFVRVPGPKNFKYLWGWLYLSGFTNCPFPGLPMILPSCITVLPRRIVRMGTPLTFLPWYGVHPTFV
jgi:hypothetical protein